MVSDNKVKRYCEEHNIEYEASVLFGGAETWCPVCSENYRIKKQEQEQERLKKEKEEEELRILTKKQDLFYLSEMPPRYSKEALSEKFPDKCNKLLLDGVNGNLFISGGIGTGKTTFLCELLKKYIFNTPLYLQASNLFVLSESDFRITNLINSLKKHEIIAIDEVQYFYKNPFLLDMIINECYNNNLIVYICGNTTLEEFTKNIPARIVSRFLQDLEHTVQFNGKDLRLKNDK